MGALNLRGVPSDLMRALKMRAAERGIPLREYCVECLRKEVGIKLEGSGESREDTGSGRTGEPVRTERERVDSVHKERGWSVHPLRNEAVRGVETVVDGPFKDSSGDEETVNENTLPTMRSGVPGQREEEVEVLPDVVRVPEEETLEPKEEMGPLCKNPDCAAPLVKSKGFLYCPKPDHECYLSGKQQGRI